MCFWTYLEKYIRLFMQPLRRNSILRRIVEIIGAVLVSIILLPFFLLTIILVQIDTPGQIIFRQRRVGKNGKPFKLYKLRTMKNNANGVYPAHTQFNDPRFSPICKLVRASCIDEYPQLWNILIGNMSFIGPRPELPKIVKKYTLEQCKVLQYKPGLFGISQLVLREGVDYNQKLRIENAYYPYRSLLKDLLVITFTPLVVFDHTFRTLISFYRKKVDYTNTAWFKFLVGTNGTHPAEHQTVRDFRRHSTVNIPSSANVIKRKQG